MPCTHANMNGISAIICGSKRIATCVKCRALATRECDWKMPGGGTCDAALCENCTHSPAPEKDLCPKHASEWIARQQDLFVGNSALNSGEENEDLP